MSWLQGGPFLDVSLIIEEINIKKLIQMITSVNCVTIYDENIEYKTTNFEVGYIYDDQDENTRKIHTLDLNLIVNVQGTRKSILHIERIAEKTVLIDFWFFGSEFDAPEWEQQGIRDEDYHYFLDFLSLLLEELKGIVGSVAIEDDVTVLISQDHVRPNKVFSFAQINPMKIVERGNQFKYIGVGVRFNDDIQITNFCK
ncbi:hypothetical protein [Cohnella sp. GCM10027633]|uniref:hypothetical protein n=1 Tax=unclassified Cohnella TaxID=2636738 RepID=UPI003627EDC5